MNVRFSKSVSLSARIVSSIGLLGLALLVLGLMVVNPQQRAFAATCTGALWDSTIAYVHPVSGGVYYDTGGGVYKQYSSVQGTTTPGVNPQSDVWNGTGGSGGHWSDGGACDIPTPTPTPSPTPTLPPFSACTAYPATLTNDFWASYIFDDMKWTAEDYNTGRIAVGGTFLYNNPNNPNGAPTGGFGNNGDCTSAPGISRPDVVVGAFRSAANAATDLYAFHNAGLRYIDQTLAPASSFLPLGQDFTSTDIYRATRCASFATAPTVAEINVADFNTLTNMAAVKTALLGADVAGTLPDNDDDPNTPGTTGDTIPGCTGSNLMTPGTLNGSVWPDPNPDYGTFYKHPTSGYSYDLALRGGVGATAVDSTGGTSFGDRKSVV